MLCIGFHLCLDILSSFLSLSNQGIDVFIRICPLLSRYDLIGTKLDHLHQIFLAQFRVLLCQSSLLDDGSIKEKFSICPLDNFLFHSSLRNESEHLHGFGLPKTMCTIHGLQVHLRIPVTVIQNDNIGGGKIDTQPTSTSTQ